MQTADVTVCGATVRMRKCNGLHALGCFLFSSDTRAILRVLHECQFSLCGDKRLATVFVSERRKEAERKNEKHHAQVPVEQDRARFFTHIFTLNLIVHLILKHHICYSLGFISIHSSLHSIS